MLTAPVNGDLDRSVRKFLASPDFLIFEFSPDLFKKKENPKLKKTRKWEKPGLSFCVALKITGLIC